VADTNFLTLSIPLCPDIHYYCRLVSSDAPYINISSQEIIYHPKGLSPALPSAFSRTLTAG